MLWCSELTPCSLVGTYGGTYCLLPQIVEGKKHIPYMEKDDIQFCFFFLVLIDNFHSC